MRTIALLTISNIFMTFALVRTLEISRSTTLQGDRYQLGNRLLRILLPSSGKPDRLLVAGFVIIVAALE
jgi:hypothetical protein